ncbi:MAG: hypothetical protein AAGD07_01535 [Planctomycetota bacterium]
MKLVPLISPTINDGIIDRFYLGKATKQDARRLASGDAETGAFTLLAIQQQRAGKQTSGPNTSLGAKPPHQKPGPKPLGKQSKKRGAQKGHPGSRRKPPIEADRTRNWVPEKCPDCGKKLKDKGKSESESLKTFNFYLRLKLKAAGLVQVWHRLAEVLFAWFQQIQEQSLDAAKLHADETGSVVRRYSFEQRCRRASDSTGGDDLQE